MTEHTKIKNEKNEILKAGCVVISDCNEILLVTDKDKKMWTFPKGHAEHGETLDQTALREVKEETGYTVKIIKRLSDVVYKNGQTGEPIRLAMFKAKPIGNPEKAEEETYSSWFPIKRAKDITYQNLSLILEEIE